MAAKEKAGPGDVNRVRKKGVWYQVDPEKFKAIVGPAVGDTTEKARRSNEKPVKPTMIVYVPPDAISSTREVIGTEKVIKDFTPPQPGQEADAGG